MEALGSDRDSVRFEEVDVNFCKRSFSYTVWIRHLLYTCNGGLIRDDAIDGLEC